MNCLCIEKIDKHLAQHNLKLMTTIVFDTDANYMDLAISLPTHFIEPQRGKKPTQVIASYCPFCGVSAKPHHETGAEETEDADAPPA